MITTDISYLENFDFEALPGSKQFRRDSLQSYLKTGLPTIKNEKWKYTNLKFLEKSKFSRQVTSSSVLPSLPPSVSSHRLLQGETPALIFVNGSLVHSQSLSGIQVNSASEFGHMSSKMFELDPFYHLNGAYCETEVTIEVPAKFDSAAPLTLLHIVDNENSAHFPRIKVQIGESASVHIHEVYESSVDMYFYSPAVHVEINENSKLQWVQLQNGATKGCHFHNFSANLANYAEINQLIVSTGAQLFRFNNHVQISRAASAFMDGVSVVNGRQHCDFHIWADHNGEHGASHQHYKSILFEKARSVFNGKISIEQQAQKVNSSQLNKNIVMSSEAEVDTKPELEVYADDVQANHGATVGSLSLRDQFYLQSRGISEEAARNMLLSAFVNEFILKYKLQETYIAKCLDKKMKSSLEASL